ncbi:hypothetical protein AYO21_09333 [Fonsecaea monophora]|uniref:NTF2-like domain-containing protein n=3 Tax=Fonsecaea TaxID=40354 RepID=A0A0D2GKL2_9EURO|nr:uncharacterized protein Z517_04428 [Fonsecaea pedrosoi CBS 271.37]XP_022504819.1 hypothetical protein AYO20_00719 [Fonsecaea nubica]XP_022508392.1 hypothetical protein AYO21_09333 [Fonsecaea monophora]KAH0847443.1 hypothetical protein FOPE_00708 [Fonsecaea pedrosoi]KIW81403.1 hypothetical protein Z517_04428 [Fonsecaea pedrosoi CBS 271.37]OAG36440.1 hypothetical protein AYO21_09333 [Fonsecaea monophora]OAL39807.1 hypothetical protein AYO20_00719 [Fonsecaea nubica]
MRFSSIIAPVSLAALASAAPALNARGYGDSDSCIPYSIAIDIETQWISTLTNFDVNVATNLLAPELVDTSDSINYIAGIPLGGPTFPSAQAYIAGQGAQPAIGFTLLGTDVVTCDGYIVLRWIGAVGQQTYPSQGITILKAVQKGSDATVGPTGWQLAEIHTEFNSAAWVADIGGTCPPPSGTARLARN